MSYTAPRTATRVIRKFRDYLLRRETGEQFRYEGVNVSQRTTAQPALPGGVSTKMSANDYHTRDGRGLSEPPRVSFKQERYMLTSGGPQAPLAAPAKPRFGLKKAGAVNRITPGAVYDYSEYIEYDASTVFDGYSNKKPPTPSF